MRAIPIGLVVGLSLLLALGLASTAQAGEGGQSQDECWISINDPTNPTWTKECEEIPELAGMFPQQDGQDECWISINDPTNPTWTKECEEPPEVSIVVMQEERQDECWISINDPTNPTWTKECEELPILALTGAQAETSLLEASTSIERNPGSAQGDPCWPGCSMETTMEATFDLGGSTITLTAETDATAWP